MANWQFWGQVFEAVIRVGVREYIDAILAPVSDTGVHVPMTNDDFHLRVPVGRGVAERAVQRRLGGWAGCLVTAAADRGHRRIHPRRLMLTVGRGGAQAAQTDGETVVGGRGRPAALAVEAALFKVGVHGGQLSVPLPTVVNLWAGDFDDGCFFLLHNNNNRRSLRKVPPNE